MYRFSIKDSHFLPHSGIDLELSLVPGKLTILTGENGVGKTSVFHRLFNENSERISLIEQKEMDSFFDRKISKIKSITQSLPLINQDRFINIWNEFKLSEKEDRLLSELSGGEAQLLKITLGLSMKKEIFLLDEPSQFLDSDKKQLLNLVLQGLSETIFIIEHDLTWIEGLNKTLRLSLSERMIRVREV